jgi:polysaccharide chain length determinant protein (PEP-CTERM system associated)
MRGYWEVATRRKWWILLCSIGLFLCAAVFARRLPDVYRAETVIQVDSAQVTSPLVTPINNGDIGGRLATLQQQVLSPTRLKKLVESEGLYPEPSGKKTETQIIRTVQKAIVVEVGNPGAGKLSTFRIAYSSPHQGEVARIANHLAQMFIEENVAARISSAEDTTQFLQEQMEDTKRQLDQKDTELGAIKSRNILELPESKPYHMEALANLRTQMQTIQDKLQQDQREKGVLQSMLLSGDDAPTVDVGSAGAGGSGNPYDAQISRLESKLSDLKSRYGPGHPDVRRTQDELNRLKAKAATEAKENPAPAVEVQQPAVQQTQRRHRNPVLEAQIARLDEEIQEQARLLQPLQAQMSMHETKLQQIPAFEQQLSRLQQDYDALKAQYAGLRDKEKTAEISHALEVHQKGEKFEVLDAAVTPTAPASPNRTLISLAGLFGGLLAGIALAAVSELNDESVRSEKEASRILGRPILSAIPEIISDKDRRASNVRAFGMLAGTVVASVTVGLLLAFLAGGLF